MKLKHIIYFAVIFVICTGCKHEVKVVLPDNYTIEIEQYMQRQEYMVMIYADSSDCTPCSFKHLVHWYSVRDKLEANKIGILLIFRNSDEKAVIRALRSIGVFHFIFDKGGKFKTANNEIFQFVKDNIFVMDRDKNAIFAESPIASEQSWKMFLKRTKKTINLKKNEENE